MTIDLHTQLKAITLLILDIDGVLTDGTLLYSANGIECLSFHVHDGYGLQQLMTHGLTVAVISSSQSPIIAKRLQDLGITHAYLGQNDKLSAYEALRKRLNFNEQEVAYLGDDLPDIPIMQRVGLSVAVANANPTVLATADWTTQRSGGQGACRELCDRILAAQDRV